MLRKLVSSYLVCIVILAGSGCYSYVSPIVSVSPENETIYMNIESTQSFSVEVSPASPSFEWILDGNPVPGATENTYDYSTTPADAGDHTLTIAVTAPEIAGSHTWNIEVRDYGDTQFRIIADPTAHNDYGLSYPVTYKFILPSDTDNLEVYEKNDLSGSWTLIEEKNAGDFFNAVDAVRFDYLDHYAYVSVAFDSSSDDIFLVFKDSEGNPVSGISFTETTEYYDGRKVAVTVTFDDWKDDSNSDFIAVCNKLQGLNIWGSPAIVTGNTTTPTWDDIQVQIDEGFIEPVSHTRTHSQLVIINPDSEIGGSAQDIKNFLDLPPLNRKGPSEYVYAWIEPMSLHNDLTRQKTGQYKYLIDRGGGLSNLVSSWSVWEEPVNTYGRTGITARMGSDGTEDLSELNNTFDDVYDNDGTYHLNFHPWALNTDAWADYGDAHLDHLKERTDVWYVAFGHLYLYHYTQERGKVRVISID